MDKWRWHVFGIGPAPNESLLLVELNWDPGRWRRVLTRILLGSKWERIGPNGPY